MLLTVTFVCILVVTWYRYIRKYLIRCERKGQLEPPRSTVIDCLMSLIIGIVGVMLGYEIRSIEQQRDFADLLDMERRGGPLTAKAAFNISGYISAISICVIILWCVTCKSTSRTKRIETEETEKPFQCDCNFINVSEEQFL